MSKKLKIITEEKFENGQVVEYVKDIKGAMKEKDIEKAIQKNITFDEIKENKDLKNSILNLLKNTNEKSYENFVTQNNPLQISVSSNSEEILIRISVLFYVDAPFGVTSVTEVKKGKKTTKEEIEKLKFFGEVLHQFRKRQKEIENNLKENTYTI